MITNNIIIYSDNLLDPELINIGTTFYRVVEDSDDGCRQCEVFYVSEIYEDSIFELTNIENPDHKIKMPYSDFILERFIHLDSPGRRSCIHDNNIIFDSSYELVFYVYAIEHGSSIVREPFRLEYATNDGTKHYYVPDFICDGVLIEIKGEHLLDENKKLKKCYKDQDQYILDAKQKCIEDNNVMVLSRNDIDFAFEYFNKKGYKLEDYRRYE